MKKNLLKFISLVLLFTSTAFAEPPNLGLVKKEVQSYHDSGLYEKEVARVIAQARAYLVEQVAINARRAQPKKLALVLDIDETSLSNYNKMVKRDFWPSTPAQLLKEVLAGDSPAILPTLSLYKKARQLGVTVFFVTGRPQFALKATRTNLLDIGYSHWAGLFLRPNSYQKKSIIPFKSSVRKAITKRGYTIIASIGDQYSDLEGGYSQRGFKVPNPFYYLP